MLDFTELQISPIQRNGDLTNTHTNDNNNNKKNLPSNSLDNNNNNNNNNHSIEKRNSSIIFQTKYPTFLPDDFTVDETDGVTLQSTGLLNDADFKHVKTIGNKLNINQSNLHIQLNEDEITFIR